MKIKMGWGAMRVSRIIVAVVAIFAVALPPQVANAASDPIISVYPSPTGPNSIYDIKTDPKSGSAWFAANGSLWEVTADGTYTERVVGGVGNSFSFGNDGSIWFVGDSSDPTINRLTIVNGSYVTTKYPTASGNSYSELIVASDGTVWAVGSENPTTGVIAKVTPDGTVSEFSLADGRPYRPTLGPDGLVWFAVQGTDNPPTTGLGGVYRVDNSGTITKLYPGINNYYINQFANSPSGEVWFSDRTGQHLGSIAVDGTFTDHSDPQIIGGVASIAITPDGMVWLARGVFTPTGPDNRVARIAPDGTIDFVETPSIPARLIALADGTVWYATQDGIVGHILADGTVTEYRTSLADAPAEFANVREIRPASDGSLWYVYNDATIVRISFASEQTPPGETPTTPGSGTETQSDSTAAGQLSYTGANLYLTIASGVALLIAASYIGLHVARRRNAIWRK